MSPRAAARLETLGFKDVYDYMPGKMDWLAFGLPVEKRDPGVSLVIEHLQLEFPTARLGDPVSQVRLRIEQAGFSTAPVLNDAGILLGAVEEPLGKTDAAGTVESIMNPGPTTVRPSVSFGNAVKQLDRLNAGELLVTSSDGKLLGLFRRPRKSSDEGHHLSAS